MNQALNVYQLEYAYKSAWAGITKSRSFFYRPEYIVDPALWKAIRTGNEITNEDEGAVKEEQEKEKRLKRAMQKYR